MPGDYALARYHEQARDGVALHPEVVARMTPHFERYDVALP